MGKKIQLSIPQPCHENWDAMTPVEKGKFCGSCQKQVVDFSTMSDRQVAEFFKRPSTGSVCGRFMTDQLQRDIEMPKKRIPWFKYFFQFALPAFLVSIKGTAQKTQGKVAVNTIKADTTKPQVVRMGMIAPAICVKPPSGGIKGDVVVETLSGTILLKVVDEKGQPIPYASIETGAIGKGGAANKNGVFNLDKSVLKPDGKIFVSSAGYERKAVEVKTISKAGGTFTVVLKSNGWLDEVVVTSIGIKSSCIVLGSVTRFEAPQLTNKTVINGKVVDENDSPVWATVQVKGTKTGAYAKEGKFSLGFTGNDDSITLLASYVGYKQREITIDKKNYSYPVIIKLEPYREMMVGELAVIRQPSKKELKNIPLVPATPDHPSAPAFRVFPNPVEAGTHLSIEIKKAEEGYHTIELLNASGQSVYRQQIWIDAKAGLLGIDLPQVAGGNYFVIMTNKKTGKKYSEKIIIQ